MVGVPFHELLLLVGGLVVRRARLLAESNRVELPVQEMARADRPAAHLQLAEAGGMLLGGLPGKKTWMELPTP